MTKQTSPFILLGIGVLASIGYFYVGPKLFGSKGAKLTDSPFSPFPAQAQPPVVLPQPPVGPTSPMVPMGPQTQLPPPRPPVNNSPNITLQNGAVPMSPQGLPTGPAPQGAFMPPPYPPIKPNPNMMFSGATFPENVPGLTYGFPMTGF
jgi:hypothetical protein